VSTNDVIQNRIELSAILSQRLPSECGLADVLSTKNNVYGTNIDDKRKAFWEDVAKYLVRVKYTRVVSNESQTLVTLIKGLKANQIDKLIETLTNAFVGNEKLKGVNDLVKLFEEKLQGTYYADCNMTGAKNGGDGHVGLLLDNYKINLSSWGITNDLIKGLAEAAGKEPAQGGALNAASVIDYLRKSEKNVREQVLRAVTPLYSVCDPDAKVSLAIKNAQGRAVSSVAKNNEYEVVIKGLEYYLLDDQKKLPDGFTLSFGDDKIKVDPKSIKVVPEGISVKIKIEDAAEKKYGLVMSIKKDIKEKDNSGKEIARTVETIVAKKDDILEVKKIYVCTGPDCGKKKPPRDHGVRF